MQQHSPNKDASPDSGRESLDDCIGEQKDGFVREFVDFLLHNKKWWLIPILVMVLFLCFLVLVGGSGAAPFIYTLF
jgi:hypothetical protein